MGKRKYFEALRGPCNLQIDIQTPTLDTINTSRTMLSYFRRQNPSSANQLTSANDPPPGTSSHQPPPTTVETVQNDCHGGEMEEIAQPAERDQDQGTRSMLTATQETDPTSDATQLSCPSVSYDFYLKDFVVKKLPGRLESFPNSTGTGAKRQKTDFDDYFVRVADRAWCKYCIAFNNGSSVFSKHGGHELKRGHISDALNKHLRSSTHNKALEVMGHRQGLKKAMAVAVEKGSKGIDPQLQTAYFLGMLMND